MFNCYNCNHSNHLHVLVVDCFIVSLTPYNLQINCLSKHWTTYDTINDIAFHSRLHYRLHNEVSWADGWGWVGAWWYVCWRCWGCGVDVAWMWCGCEDKHIL